MAAKGTKQRRRKFGSPRQRKTPPPVHGPNSWLGCLLSLLWSAVRPRADLVLENLALRHQLMVQQRAVRHPRFTDRDRLFWRTLARVYPRWRECLAIVKPDTVLRWHRATWSAFWHWRSKPARIGRPPIGWKLARLIRRLSLENVTWRAQRIHDELLLLGHDVGVETVRRYMAKHRRPGGGQHWMTFLRNHMQVTAACDFFTVPTVTFRSLFVFVVLSHDRRLIRHIAVTTNPTAAWTARQIVEAFPGGEEPEMLLRDNDGIYGDDFSRTVKAMGIKEIRTAYRSPWMNPFSERVNGTLRRECTDHVLAINARHLERVLREYVEQYYNPARSHMSLDGNSPIPRTRDVTPAGDVIATPVLGGLHHTYRRAA